MYFYFHTFNTFNIKNLCTFTRVEFEWKTFTVTRRLFCLQGISNCTCKSLLYFYNSAFQSQAYGVLYALANRATSTAGVVYSIIDYVACSVHSATGCYGPDRLSHFHTALHCWCVGSVAPGISMCRASPIRGVRSC